MSGIDKSVYRCWQCGSVSENLILPLSRREECENCRAELHVCRMCVDYDPRVSDQCREDRAEAVIDKTRANFCDYMKLSTNAYQNKQSGQQSVAKAKLDALFGGVDTDEDYVSESVADKELSKEEKAKRELAKLFGEDK